MIVEATRKEYTTISKLILESNEKLIPNAILDIPPPMNDDQIRITASVLMKKHLMVFVQRITGLRFFVDSHSTLLVAVTCFAVDCLGEKRKVTTDTKLHRLKKDGCVGSVKRFSFGMLVVVVC